MINERGALSPPGVRHTNGQSPPWSFFYKTKIRTPLTSHQFFWYSTPRIGIYTTVAQLVEQSSYRCCLGCRYFYKIPGNHLRSDVCHFSPDSYTGAVHLVTIFSKWQAKSCESAYALSHAKGRMYEKII